MLRLLTTLPLFFPSFKLLAMPQDVPFLIVILPHLLAICRSSLVQYILSNASDLQSAFSISPHLPFVVSKDLFPSG